MFRQSIDLYLLAGGITVVSAIAGAARSIWESVSLPPAVAMRPPAPLKPLVIRCCVARLVGAEATVGKGLVMKRFRARARGRAGRIETESAFDKSAELKYA